MPLMVLDRETRWIACAGATYLPEDAKAALDFDYFFGVGRGITAIADRVDVVSALSARASRSIGEDVIGWSARRSLPFERPQNVPPSEIWRRIRRS